MSDPVNKSKTEFKCESVNKFKIEDYDNEMDPLEHLEMLTARKMKENEEKKREKEMKDKRNRMMNPPKNPKKSFSFILNNVM